MSDAAGEKLQRLLFRFLTVLGLYLVVQVCAGRRDVSHSQVPLPH